MDPKAPNFTPYDFLGYFFPGAFAVLFADAYFWNLGSTAPFNYETLLLRYAGKDLGIALPFIIISYIVGHLLSYASSLSLERYAIWRYGHPSRTLFKMQVGKYLETSGRNSLASKILRIIVWILLLPITLFDWFFGTYAKLRSNYICDFDPLLSNIVFNAVNRIVLLSRIKEPEKCGPPETHDFWKLAVHYAISHSPNHIYTLRNYVVIYGFLRTTAFAFVVIFWVLTLHFIASSYSAMKATAILAVASLICFGTFAAFVKFFQRYHEEALLAATMAVYGDEKAPELNVITYSSSGLNEATSSFTGSVETQHSQPLPPKPNE